MFGESINGNEIPLGEFESNGPSRPYRLMSLQRIL